jgi:hypothetical protein
LHAVGHYSTDDYEVVYLRDDVREQYSDDEIEDVVEDLRWESFAKSTQERQYRLGSLNCSMQAFEEGIVMHFPYDDNRGTLISLEPRAARQLTGCIDDCLSQINDVQNR